MKVLIGLGSRRLFPESDLENLHGTSVIRRDAENNVRSGRAVHLTITKLERSRHIKEDLILFHAKEIGGTKTRGVVHTEKVTS